MRIDLAQDGLPDQWVEIEDIGAKSPKQFRKLTSLPTSEADLSQLKPDEAAEAGRSFIRMVVKAWSVKDPETGQSLPAPDSSDLDPESVPMVVSGRIKAEVWGRIEEIQTLKPRSRNA